MGKTRIKTGQSLNGCISVSWQIPYLTAKNAKDAEKIIKIFAFFATSAVTIGSIEKFAPRVKYTLIKFDFLILIIKNNKVLFKLNTGYGGQ